MVCKALYSFKRICRLWLQWSVSDLRGAPDCLKGVLNSMQENLGAAKGLREAWPWNLAGLWRASSWFAWLSWGRSRPVLGSSPGQHYFSGERWTYWAQVWASLLAGLGCIFSVWKVEFHALWGPFQILNSAVLVTLHFVLISESIAYSLEMSLWL